MDKRKNQFSSKLFFFPTILQKGLLEQSLLLLLFGFVFVLFGFSGLWRGKLSGCPPKIN